MLKALVEGVLNLVFLILCFMGLMYQVVILTDGFFRYPIKIGVNLFKADILPPLAVTFCGKIYDIFDYDAMRAENMTVWKYVESPDDVDLKIIEKTASLVDEHLNIEQIMKFTPSPESVIIRVSYRKNNSYVIYEEDDPSNITELLQVKKFLYLEYMCYTVGFTSYVNLTLRSHSCSGTPVKPGVLFELTLNENMRRTLNAKIVLHRAARAPHRSLKNSGTIVKSVRNKNSDKKSKGNKDNKKGKDDTGKDDWVRYNRFVATRVLYNYKLLPVPYETQCFDYSEWRYTSEIDCAQDCLLYNVRQDLPGYLPFTGVIYDTDNFTTDHRLSYHNLSDPEIASLLNQLDNFCWKRKCKLMACDKGISETHVSSFRSDDNFTIVIHAPQLPFVDITVTPWMSFAEFLTSLFSIIGVWTGVSVFGMDPVLLLKTAKTKINHHFGKEKKTNWTDGNADRKKIPVVYNRTASVSQDLTLNKKSSEVRVRRTLNILKERRLLELLTRVNRMQNRVDNLKHFVQTRQLSQLSPLTVPGATSLTNPYVNHFV